MQIVVENHFNLVRFIINRKFNNVPIEYDDLFQVGCIGLIKAIHSYDEEKGAFTTYASMIVTNEILMEIRKLKRLIIPFCSIEETLPDNPSISYGDIIASSEQLIENELADKSCIDEWLNTMPKMHKRMITMSANGLNQCVISEKTGYSQSHISRILKMEKCRYEKLSHI